MKGKNAIILLLAAIPLLAFAASEYGSDSKIAAGVIGTVSTNVTYEINPSSLFSFDGDFGQDLYETTYERLKSEASDRAAQRILADRRVSREELFALVSGANIGAIQAQPDPSAKLDPQEVERRRVELQRALAEEKELADLLVQTTMEVESTELFANGDESDSGFDLLTDLRVINMILFGKTETPLSNAGAGAPAGGNELNFGAGTASSGGQGESGGPASGAANASAVAGSRVSRAGGAAAGSGSQGAPSPDGGYPVSCPLDASFNSAVESLRAAERIGERQDAGPSTGRSGRESSRNGSASSDGSGASAPDGGPSQTNSPEILEPQPPADWSRPRSCDGVFCLKVEPVYKKESSYQSTDNCIACHFEKINDAFNKTVSHNLVPSKATGNLIEAPKCKRWMFNLKQSIILIPQPILTPPNDDLVTKGDFIKNTFDFFEKYYDNPGRCAALEKAAKGSGAAGGSCKPDPDPRGQAASRAVEQASEGTEQQKIFIEIQNQVAAKTREAQQALKNFHLQADAAQQAEPFSVLGQELDAMNGYFRSFRDLYLQVVASKKGSKSPCSALLSKPVCN